MSRTFLCVSLCALMLCNITALTLDWTPCPAITDISSAKLTKFDYASAEQFHNLPKDTLRPASNDTEFSSNIKKILIRSRFPTYGFGVQENEEPVMNYNVPNDLVSECSTMKVPYYNNKTTSRININYFAKRYRALSGQRKGVIYMLQGGPGAGGEALEPMGLQLWSQMKGQYDIILPDHRGTARSSPLSCEPTSSYLSTVYQCQTKVSIGYSNNLDGFSADEAAMDTLSLMKAVKKAEGGLNYLYGVSYGTYVSHRIIQIDPDAVDAVILDGICGGKFCDFTRADLAFETTAKDFFAMCAKDSTCSSKLGHTQDEVAAQVKLFYAANNECTNMFIGIDKEDTLKKLFTAALMDPVLRLLIPAIVYRGRRCGVADRIAIVLMINNYALYQSSENARKTYPLSSALNFNIGVSELQGRYGDKQKMEVIVKGCHICNGASLVYPSLYNAGWKAYPESSYAYTYAKYNKPLLMLNGDLDPQTYYVAADAFATEVKQTAPMSRLIRFPSVVHYVLGRSPLASNLDDNCGLDIAVRFFNDPSSLNNLDTSCTSQLLGLPFGGYSVTYDHVATDLYEGMGLNKKQLTTFILVIVFIILAVLSCCVCCGVCCCYLGRVACFKKKPAGERGPLLVVSTNGTQPNLAPYYTN